MILEAAVNVVLPSSEYSRRRSYCQILINGKDGEAWIKLRNDDFSDLNEHYRSRGQTQQPNQEDEVVPELSTQLINIIKGMMRSDPGRRMTLGGLSGSEVMVHLRAMKEDDRLKPALLEESLQFSKEILGQL